MNLQDGLQVLKRMYLLRAGPWIRPTVIATVLMIPIIAWVVKAFPNAVLPWPQLVLCLLLSGPLLMAWADTPIVIWPRHISLDCNCIRIMNWHAVLVIDREDLHRIVILVADTGQRRLAIKFRDRRGREREIALIITDSVDLDAIRYLLGQLDSGAPSRNVGLQ